MKILTIILAIFFWSSPVVNAKIACSDGCWNYMAWTYIGNDWPDDKFLENSGYMKCVDSETEKVWDRKTIPENYTCEIELKGRKITSHSTAPIEDVREDK